MFSLTSVATSVSVSMSRFSVKRKAELITSGEKPISVRVRRTEEDGSTGCGSGVGDGDGAGNVVDEAGDVTGGAGDATGGARGLRSERFVPKRCGCEPLPGEPCLRNSLWGENEVWSFDSTLLVSARRTSCPDDATGTDLGKGTWLICEYCWTVASSVYTSVPTYRSFSSPQ